MAAAELLGAVSPGQNGPVCPAHPCVPDTFPLVPQLRTGTDDRLAQDLSPNTVGAPFQKLRTQILTTRWAGL